jgi:hypothetical protein
MSYCRVALCLFVPLAFSMNVACGDDDDEADAAPAADAGAPDAFFDPSNPLQPPHPDDGVQFAMDITAPAQTEVWRCVVGPIPGAQPGLLLDFNLVESRQSANIHHMDLSVLTLPEDDIADGDYDCNELYAQYPKLMDEIIIYASQHAEQKLQLPPGVVAEVPSGLKTMLEVHYVNTTDEEQSVYTRVNAYWIDPHDVTALIWGNAVRDRHLTIPKGGSTDEWTRCEMNMDVDLLVLSTHTHQLAVETNVYRWASGETGELVYTNLDWHAPLLMDLTSAPMHVKKGEGFEFHCHYENPSDKDVAWGFSAQDEMCQMAIVYTPGNTAAKCIPVETSDGVILE